MSIKRFIFNFFDAVCKIVLTVIAVMFIIRGVRYAYDIGRSIFDQQPVSLTDTRTVSVTIADPDAEAVGKALKEKGLINDVPIFRIQERLSVYHDMIATGTYELSPSMKPDEMIEIMAAPTVEARKAENEAKKSMKAAASNENKTEDGATADESDDSAGMGDLPEEGTGDDQLPSEEEILERMEQEAEDVPPEG